MCNSLMGVLILGTVLGDWHCVCIVPMYKYGRVTQVCTNLSSVGALSVVGKPYIAEC